MATAGIEQLHGLTSPHIGFVDDLISQLITYPSYSHQKQSELFRTRPHHGVRPGCHIVSTRTLHCAPGPHLGLRCTEGGSTRRLACTSKGTVVGDFPVRMTDYTVSILSACFLELTSAKWVMDGFCGPRVDFPHLAKYINRDPELIS